MDMAMLDTDSDASYNSARSPQEAPGDAEDSLSDTATVGGMSEAGEEVRPEFTLPESPIVVERRTVRAPNASFAAISDVDLKSCFTFRACVMRTCLPHHEGCISIGDSHGFRGDS